MIDLPQIILIVVVTILTILLTLVGFQVYALLKELRVSVKKINHILDNTGVVSDKIAEEVTGLSEIIDNFIKLFSFLKYFRRK